MASLRTHTPCDERDPVTGQFYCPYIGMDGYVDCHYWCSAEEPADYPEVDAEEPADYPEVDAEEPADYPEVDAEELAEFQSFCDFIEGR